MAKRTGTATSPADGTPSSSSITEPNKIHGFFNQVGMGAHIPENCQSKDFYSDLISNLITVDNIKRGRISCRFSVLPVIANYYGGLHGAALAAMAERVAIACARTVVDEDKDMFLGDLSLSYLLATPKNEELVVSASVLRSGKIYTLVAMEFRIDKSGKLAYTARATFYNMPVANL